MSKTDVLVVGAGIGGLSTAIALGEVGCRVTCVEIKPDLHSSVFGVGIIQPVNALRALDAIGCAAACMELGYPAATWMKIFDVGGTLVREIPGKRIPGSPLPVLNGITRPLLHRILTDRAIAAGARIQYGKTVDTLADQGDRVDVVFDDGSAGTFEFVVGADGVGSQIRRYVHPELVPIYNGQSAFRFNFPRDPEIDCIVMQQTQEVVAGMVPLADDLAYLFANVSWDRSRRLSDDELCPILRDLLAPFGGPIGRVRDRYVNEDAAIVLRPEEWLIAPPPWHRGRVVLIGDAVHAVTPHLGQGAAQAIEDGVVLAESLVAHESLESAFNAYVDRRYQRCKLIVEASVQLGEWQQRPDPAANPVALRERVLDEMLAPI